MACGIVTVMASRALEERLEQLRESYRARLGEKLDALDATLRRALQDASAASTDELWAVAHNLAGTAGSYGFKDLAKAVREMEDMVAPFRGGESLPKSVGEGLVLLMSDARRLAA